jgi:peptidoglycan/xylan/chitin deacetylase (PgdA/CDA1 family)
MIPVLMYHSVSDDPAPGTRALAVRPATFARHLETLDALGYRTVTMARLVEHWRRRARGESGLPLPARPVVLTFDDGYRDFHTEALPLLRAHQATATLYVTTGWLADAGKESAGRPLGPMLSWDQVAECAAAGVEIGGHSHSHPQLDRLPEPRLREELRRNRELLVERLSEAPGGVARTFGYPFGYSDARVRAAVREAGYAGACAVANRPASPSRQSPYALARLTVGEGTSEAALRDLLQGRGVQRHYLAAHALTKGYALYRRATQPAARRRNG